MNTTNNSPAMTEEFPKTQLWRESVIFKKLIPHFDLNTLSRSVWILSQLTASVSELQQKKSTWVKINCRENCLNTSLFAYCNVVYYIHRWIFSRFSTRLMVISIEIDYQYISSLTQWTILPNSKTENCDYLFSFCQRY